MGKVTLFLFGLMVGSFLNVCIWRLPEGEQVVKGRSHCRGCGHVIPGHDNIPVLSFLLLGGRCRFCKARISWAYPAVELITAFFFLAIVTRFGFTPLAAIYAVLGAALIVVTVIDAREMIIPNEITRPGFILGMIFSFLVPTLHATQNHWRGLSRSVLGIVAGAGIIWGMAFLGKQFFREKLKAIGETDAMGEGDMWLMAMIGSFIGPLKVFLVNLFLAPLFGSIVGTVIKYRTRQDLIPYGPFLVAGTVVTIFWGDTMIHWYQAFLLGHL